HPTRRDRRVGSPRRARTWNVSGTFSLAGRPRRSGNTCTVAGLESGGGGNRTPVRRCIHEHVYVCSLWFVVTALAPAGRISRGQPAFDLDPRAAGARGGPARSMTLEPALRPQAGRAWRPIRQPVRSYCLQLSSPARVTG